LILIDILVVSVWIGVDPPNISLQLDPIRTYVLVQRCTMNFKTAWFGMLIVPKLAVLVYGMQLSYGVRNIDKTFRKSNSIAVAIIGLFLCGAITTPILILVWQQIDVAQILLTIGVTIGMVSVALVLFVPKFWKILIKGVDTTQENRTLDMSGTSHSWKPDNRPDSRGTMNRPDSRGTIPEDMSLKAVSIEGSPDNDTREEMYVK